MYRIVAVISIILSLFSTFRSIPIDHQQNIEQNSNLVFVQTTQSQLDQGSSKNISTMQTVNKDKSIDCEEEEVPKISDKTVGCLNHCGYCVKQWKSGLYNGAKCANDCVSRQEDPLGVVDLDCDSSKYFNYQVAKVLRQSYI